MIPLQELRRINLSLLVDKYGLTYVAKKVDRSKPQISNMVNGTKSFGEKVARSIESLWDPEKDTGWLDEENSKVLDYVRAKKKIKHDPIIITIGAIETNSEISNKQLKLDTNNFVKSISVTQEWLESRVGGLTDHKDLRIYTCTDKSVRPLYELGDILLVDITKTEIVHGDMYLFSCNNELFVRRFQYVPGQGLFATAENKNFMSWKVENTKFQIYGKVLVGLKTIIP